MLYTCSEIYKNKIRTVKLDTNLTFKVDNRNLKDIISVF